jgi:hypothetical protein
MKELKCPFHTGLQGWRCMNNTNTCVSAIILFVARFGIIRFRVQGSFNTKFTSCMIYCWAPL